jgi:predicted RNA-binding protein (virulence factor B family)
VTSCALFTATPERPPHCCRSLEPAVGQFATMGVRGVTTTGAFLDWGLERRTLLLPTASAATAAPAGG